VYSSHSSAVAGTGAGGAAATSLLDVLVARLERKQPRALRLGEELENFIDGSLPVLLDWAGLESGIETVALFQVRWAKGLIRAIHAGERNMGLALTPVPGWLSQIALPGTSPTATAAARAHLTGSDAATDADDAEPIDVPSTMAALQSLRAELAGTRQTSKHLSVLQDQARALLRNVSHAMQFLNVDGHEASRSPARTSPARNATNTTTEAAGRTSVFSEYRFDYDGNIIRGVTAADAAAVNAGSATMKKFVAEALELAHFVRLFAESVDRTMWSDSAPMMF
jgi:hypothetical protein